MFTSMSYPTDMDFMVNVTMELIQNIERMAHHPSLILLFRNNEIDMTYTMLTSDGPRTAQTRDFFEVSKITDENMKHIMQTRYKTLFLETIPDITKRSAPQVPYAHSSPNRKSNHTSKSIFDYAKDGDFHYYLAYDGQAPYESIKQLHARFISEMGFQSYPGMKTIDSFSKTSDQSPNSSVMLTHQKCKDGNQIIDNYMQAEFKLTEDFTDYVYLSQILAGIVMRYSVEHFRSENDYCRGVLLWQMNDCWPTISWSGVDYYGRWKAQQYFTKRFYASVLPVIHISHKSVNMTVVNDLTHSFEGLFTWQLKHYNNLLNSGEVPVTVTANHHFQLSGLHLNDLANIPLNELYFEYQLYDNIIANGIELFVKPSWQRTPGVTLLGDAAHLMAPSGEGANLAMYDAAELGKLIVEYPNDIELALENYEQALFKRSAAEAEESHELLDLCLGQDAPYGLIALFEGSNEQN